MTPTGPTVNSNPGPSQHDQAVANMFGGIARFYDLLNRVLSLNVDRYWRYVLARSVRPGTGGVVLDLASGTLDVALAIRKRFPDATVPALDFCLPMLRLGLPKLKGANRQAIMPVGADAKHLPLPDNTVDCITIAFGIRNIIPRQEAFAEMLRVLRPGGRACILEFGSGQERIWGGIYNFYLHRILPWMGRLVSRDKAAYTYLADTITAFPRADVLMEEMRQAGFVNTSYERLTGGIVCLHLGEKA